MPRKMRLALMGAALALASTGVTISIAGVASASGSPTVTTNFSGHYVNGETITVSGTGFPSASADPTGIQIIECADPGGTIGNLPVDDSTCDGSTQNPLPIFSSSSGSFSTTYQISSLSTSDASNINCDATDYCVLWVGVDYQNSFTANDAFSAPFELNGTTPSITSGSSATFAQGPQESFQMTGTGSPAPVFSETGALPSGITLSSSGKLSGATGANAGTYNVTVTANNGVSTATQSFALTVTAATSATVVDSPPPAATVGSSYNYTLKAAGPITQPIKWKVSGKLPKGLKLNKATGQISGTPTSSKHTKTGPYPISASFKDHSKPKKSSNVQNFTITLSL